jgi:hypothetical protein
MRLPASLDRRNLAQFAAPNETHAVRVVLQKVANSAPYLVRGRLRRYIFERNPEVGAHCLDIPVSVWMANLPKGGSYRQNESIADDLRPTIQLPFIIHVVPWKGAKVSNDPPPSVWPAVHKILAFFNPPTVVEKALNLAEAGNAAALDALAVEIAQTRRNPEAPPTEVPAADETPAQARARKMREAKAAKKAANLQPA